MACIALSYRCTALAYCPALKAALPLSFWVAAAASFSAVSISQLSLACRGAIEQELHQRLGKKGVVGRARREPA